MHSFRNSLISSLIVALLPLVTLVQGCESSDPNDPQYWVNQLKTTKRTEAIKQLGSMGSGDDEKAKLAQTAIPRLVKLYDSDKDRGEVILSLIAMKAKDADTLRVMKTAITDKNEMGAAAAAADYLGDIGAKEALKELLAVVDTTMEDEVKAGALRAVIKFKDPAAVDDLIRILDRGVDQQWIHLNALACKALGEIGSPDADRALSSLVRGIFLRDKFSRMSFRDCAVALLKFRTAAAKALTEAITGEDKEVNKWSEEQGHVSGLISEEASKVLGLLGDKAAAAALVKELYVRNEPPPNYDAKKAQIWAAIEAQRFQNAVEALGRIGDASAIAPLAKYLYEGDYIRRTRVPFAINFIGDPAGVPVLAECAKKAIVSGLGWFRLDCAKYLGHLAGPGDIATMKALLPGLEKLRKELTDYAATDPRSSGDFIGKLDGFTLQIAAMESCKSDPACWQGKVDDKNTHVREQAVWQLSRLAAGNPKALEALLAKVGDEDFALRNAVLDVLPRICDKRCLDAIEAVQDKEAGKARYKGFRDRMMFVHTQIATKG